MYGFGVQHHMRVPGHACSGMSVAVAATQAVGFHERGREGERGAQPWEAVHPRRDADAFSGRHVSSSLVSARRSAATCVTCMRVEVCVCVCVTLRKTTQRDKVDATTLSARLSPIGHQGPVLA